MLSAGHKFVCLWTSTRNSRLVATCTAQNDQKFRPEFERSAIQHVDNSLRFWTQQLLDYTVKHSPLSLKLQSSPGCLCCKQFWRGLSLLSALQISNSSDLNLHCNAWQELVAVDGSACFCCAYTSRQMGHKDQAFLKPQKPVLQQLTIFSAQVFQTSKQQKKS